MAVLHVSPRPEFRGNAVSIGNFESLCIQNPKGSLIDFPDGDNILKS